MERYLIHSAKGSTWSKKDHKYISRKKVNGKWVYTYNNPESRNYRQDQMMDLSTREMYTKSKSPQYKDELGMYDNIDDLIDALKTKRRNNAELVSKASGITSKHTYSDNVKKYDQAIKEANDIKKEEEDLAKNPTILKKLKHIRHSDNTVYLVHHGILGQKWGIRRFQNPDGSYTEAGKKRYGNLTEGKQIEKRLNDLDTAIVYNKRRNQDLEANKIHRTNKTKGYGKNSLKVQRTARKNSKDDAKIIENNKNIKKGEKDKLDLITKGVNLGYDIHEANVIKTATTGKDILKDLRDISITAAIAGGLSAAGAPEIVPMVVGAGGASLPVGRAANATFMGKKYKVVDKAKELKKTIKDATHAEEYWRDQNDISHLRNYHYAYEDIARVEKEAAQKEYDKIMAKRKNSK